MQEEKTGVTAVSLHPGVIYTNLTRHHEGLMVRVYFALSRPFNKTIPQGAATSLYCAAADAVTGGAYYLNCHEGKVTASAEDTALAKELWDFSAKVTGSDC
ncbi:unnamed protein product [Phaeothamnion confervicola]